MAPLKGELAPQRLKGEVCEAHFCVPAGKRSEGGQDFCTKRRMIYKI